MAAPTTTHSVTVRKLSSTITSLWTKIKSTFQTLGNLVTAWGSTPSDAKYPSEKLVKDSLDAISTNARTIPQDISKGANLVVNSNGTLQTNYNWTATTFIGDTDLPEGVAGCFHRVGGDFFCNEFISLNTSKEFTVESWYRVKTANTSTVRLTLACFDIDKKSIQATDICYGIGTLTTVAREIKNGDTEIYLTDLSASAWDTSNYYERRLIFWDYQNSLGYTYPPETYSKHTYYKSNSSNGTWLRGSLDRENNKITLIAPWGGGTVPVGTKVSRGGSGSTYYYAATSPASGAATVWTKLSGKLKGFSNNVAGGGPFRPGTAFVKIGWVNANTASPEWFEFCGIELRENPSAFNGVLPVANGGTGATTKKAAEYAINGGMAQASGEPQDSFQFVFSRVGADQSATNGVFLYRTAATIWSWIEGKISSVLGLSNINDTKTFTGDSATASAAKSGSALETAINGKQDSLGISSQGDAGKFLNEQGSFVIPPVGTVSGVKGNAESSYRTGQVNLTPANIGAMPMGPSSGDYVGQTNRAWCIKLTRLATSGRGYAHVTLDMSRASNYDDFGWVDIAIKTDSSDWYAVAYPHVRRGNVLQFAQCYYTASNFSTVGGVAYIGIQCSGWSSKFSPRLSGDMMSGQFSVEFGDYHSLVTGSGNLLDTRFTVYTKYAANTDAAAVGGGMLPVYINEQGQVTTCTSKLITVKFSSTNYNLYGSIGNYSDGDMVNVINSGSSAITVQLSSSTSDTASIAVNRSRMFTRMSSSRWAHES